MVRVRCSLSAVSKPNCARKYAFVSSRRDLEICERSGIGIATNLAQAKSAAVADAPDKEPVQLDAAEVLYALWHG